MKQALKLTLHTARNPFGGVPPTHLLRRFQTLSNDYTRQIRKLYKTPFDDVTAADLEQLESLSSKLHSLAHVFREVGNRLNPFATLENTIDDNGSIDWLTFHDYQEMVDFYLTVALPKFPRQDFYGWLCHDMIEQTKRIMESGSFQKLNRKSYEDITERSNAALWKFEAIIDAAAKFERQQFGEE